MSEHTDDPFVDEDESPSERIARQNMEADLSFLAFLRSEGLRRAASEEVVDALAKFGDDPRLSDIRRYAHALGILIEHSATWEDEPPDEKRAPVPGTWEHTVTTIKAMSKDQLREALIASRLRQHKRIDMVRVNDELWEQEQLEMRADRERLDKRGRDKTYD